eukprot:scaffold61631_cov57-Attheya_sp.AAC.1
MTSLGKTWSKILTFIFLLLSSENFIGALFDIRFQVKICDPNIDYTIGVAPLLSLSRTTGDGMGVDKSALVGALLEHANCGGFQGFACQLAKSNCCIWLGNSVGLVRNEDESHCKILLQKVPFH